MSPVEAERVESVFFGLFLISEETLQKQWGEIGNSSCSVIWHAVRKFLTFSILIDILISKFRTQYKVCGYFENTLAGREGP